MIARNLNPAVPNNHVQLTYSETFGWINHTCWPNQLDAAGQNALQSKFDALKQTTQFFNQWTTANEEGFYPYRELLNAATFPAGPLMCYPMNTDARTPV